MLLGTPFTALALTAVLGPMGVGANEGDAQELMLVRYDLRTVLPQFDVGSSWRQSLVSELADPERDFSNVNVHELYEEAASEVVIDVVTQVLGDELHYEGRELTPEGDYGLVVLAPATVQEQVASVLGALEKALNTAADVRLDVFVLEADDSNDLGAQPAAEPSGVITAQQADRLVERLTTGGARHARHRLRLSPGRTAVVDQTRRRSFTGDYDVEVATGAFIFDPVGREVTAGFRFLARGVPTRGGTAISLLTTQHDSVGELRERPVELAGTVSGSEKAGVQVIPGPEALQVMDLATHSFACTTFLPTSGAVVMSSETRLGGRPMRQVIVLRSLGVARNALHRVSIPGTDRTLILVNDEALRRPTFELDTGVFYFGLPYLVADLNDEPSAFLFDWLPYRFNVWRQLGPWAVIVTSPSWDDRSGAELERLVNATRLEERTVALTAELRRSVDGAPVVARWSAPVLPGTECGVVLGLTSSVLRDYAAEVAQYATVLDPVVIPTFEGLVLGLDLARQGDEVFVAAEGTGQRRVGPVGTFAAKGQYAGRLDQLEEEVFPFDESRRVPLGQAIELGAESAGEGPGLGLRISVGG